MEMPLRLEDTDKANVITNQMRVFSSTVVSTERPHGNNLTQLSQKMDRFASVVDRMLDAFQQKKSTLVHDHFAYTGQLRTIFLQAAKENVFPRRVVQNDK